MTTAQLPAEQANTELAISGGQTRFTEVQVAALRQIGVEDAADSDLDVFFHHCARTGLDPFAKQIYMIPRETDVRVRVELPNGNSRVETQRVTKFTIQTGIDGYRLIGRRAAKRENVVVSNDDPLWCGNDGAWRDFWPKAEGTPVAAKYTIRVDGAPTTATCMFDEFAQYSGRGELTSMWKKMPANQLAVRAEAAAWRKAFPADFAGVSVEGDHQVIDPDGAPVRVPSRRRGVDGLRQQLAEQEPEDPAPQPMPTPADAEPADEHMSTPTRRKWLNRMFQLLNDGDCTDREDQLIVLAGTAKAAAKELELPDPGLQLEHRDDLDDDWLRKVVTQLNHWNKHGQLGSEITEILNQHTLAQTETATTTTEQE